jgi:VCBS repeat-containing protein
VILTSSGATAAAFQTALRQITYSNTSHSPNTTNRAVQVVLEDIGGGFSNTALAAVSVSASNDRPVANNDALSTTEDTAITGVSVLADHGSGIDRDPDSGDTLTVTRINNSVFTAGTPLTLSSGARLTMNAGGTFSYDPNGKFESLRLGQSATDSFTYTINDGQGQSNSTATATVTITISGRNDAPIAAADALSTTEDTAITGVSVFADHESGIDRDPDSGDTLTVTRINNNVFTAGTPLTLPSGARLTMNAGGTLSYDPNGKFESLRLGQSATDSFTYTIDDVRGQSNSTATAAVTITIAGRNDAPIAAADALSTTEDTAITGVSVLADHGSGIDRDPDSGDTLTVTRINNSVFTAGTPLTLPSGARLTMNAGGTFNYDPNGKFESLRLGQSATDSFTYTINDGRGQSNSTATATVTITIAGRNDAPQLNLDANNSAGNAPNFAVVFDINAPSPVAISDADLTISDVDDPNLATATVTITNRQDGSNERLSATPSGAIAAGDINFDAASGVLTISPAGGAPRADFQQVLRSLRYNNTDVSPTSQVDRIITVVVNDGTADSPLRSAMVTLQPLSPGLSLDLDGSAGGSGYATAFVEAGVTAGSGPVKIADSDVTIVAPRSVVRATVTLNNRLDGAAEGLVVNVAGLPSGISLAGASTAANVILTSSGATAAAFQTALRQITYSNTSHSPNTTNRAVSIVIEDNVGRLSNLAMATISVTASNDAPVAQPDAVTIDEDTVFSGNVLVDNGNGPDTDVDGSISVTRVNNIVVVPGTPFALPSGARLTMNAGGTFDYNPNGKFNQLGGGESGSDSFDYTIDDGQGQSNSTATATVTISIRGRNDRPVAQPDTLATDANVVLAGGNLLFDNGAGPDLDPDSNDNITVTKINGSPFVSGTAVALMSGALLTINANGAFSYNPNGQFDSMGVGQTASDSFEYTIDDGRGQPNSTATATATVTIRSSDAYAYFALNEGTGNQVGGGGINGTVQGPAWVVGPFGSALHFDGNNDYVDLGNADLPTDAAGLTLAAWIKVDDAGTIDERRIISKATGTSNENHYWMLSTYDVGSDSRLRFRLKTGDSPTTGTTTLIANSGDLQSGVWHHAAATYDGAEMRLYLDGVLVGQAAKTGQVATNASVPASIGRNPNGSGHWEGLIDEVRVYARGLSPTEVFALAGQAVDPDTDPPVISNIQSSAGSITAAITWTTDEEATSRIEYGTSPAMGSSTTLDNTLVNSHNVDLAGLLPGTTYYYVLHSVDETGNASASSQQSFVTTAQDTLAPTVSLTSPTAGATVSGQVSLSANASDNIGVTQVEFKVNGNSIGVDTTAPYAVSWNSASVSNGNYNLTAVARDAAGNMTTSTAVTLTVNNSSTVVNVSTPAALQTALNDATGGETILLAGGNYGAVSINNRSYPSMVTIQSQSGQLAVFNQLTISDSSRVTVDRVRVSYPTNPPFNSTLGLVEVDGISSDVTVSNSEIHGPVDGDYGGGTGIRVEGTTTGVRIENNMIHDTRDGMLFSGATNLSVIGNQVENIRKDVMSFIGVQQVLIENNTGARFRHPESGDHLDFIQFQGQDSRDVIIRGNVVLPGSEVTSQGIFMDDATYTNFKIENNVIYAGNNRGISFGTDAIDGGGNVARYNTILTPPNWGGKAGLLGVPGGNNEYNITSHNSKNDGVNGTNHVINYDEPGSPLYYNAYYQNAMAGAGITIEDLRPVAGSPAETLGAFARINELLGL